MTEKQISEEIKISIVKELIEPAYVDDIKNTIRGKRCWRLSGQIFETMAKVFVVIGGIMSFSSGYYNDPVLSFIAGSLNTVSLATLQFSSFSFRENKKLSTELNVLLEKLNIDTVPVLERNADTNSVYRAGSPHRYAPSLERGTSLLTFEESPSSAVIENEEKEGKEQQEIKGVAPVLANMADIGQMVKKHLMHKELLSTLRPSK